MARREPNPERYLPQQRRDHRVLMAVEMGNPEGLRRALRRGGSPNAEGLETYQRGRKALEIAAERYQADGGRGQVLDILLDAGAVDTDLFIARGRLKAGDDAAASRILRAMEKRVCFDEHLQEPSAWTPLFSVPALDPDYQPGKFKERVVQWTGAIKRMNKGMLPHGLLHELAFKLRQGDLRVRTQEWGAAIAEAAFILLREGARPDIPQYPEDHLMARVMPERAEGLDDLLNGWPPEGGAEKEALLAGMALWRRELLDRTLGGGADTARAARRRM